MSDSTQASTDRLGDLLIKTSRTFAISIPELPDPTRQQVTIAYLLFRIADTLEDATVWDADRKREQLRLFGELLDRPTPEAAAELATQWRADPPLDHAGYLELLDELALVVEAFEAMGATARDSVRLHTQRTVERMIAFVGRVDENQSLELRDVADLQAYCYAVAGIVGEMLTELFLLDRPQLDPVADVLRSKAARFGEALQLVNILKDAAGDAREGRRYLPEGVDPALVFALARGDLDDADRYVLALQSGGAVSGLVAFCALPVLLARGTLDRVEADGPGAKLSRDDVKRISSRLHEALDRGDPAVP